MIILVEWQVFRAILPLGVKFESFERLNYGREIGSPTVLLLSESGYAPANPPEWLLNLSPSLYVLSVAGDDPNGLPNSELVDLLSEKTVLRTDRNGWIDISTDGEQIWVEVERK
jgi:beta-lactamase superfamily II metal-dependent hydrolase